MIISPAPPRARASSKNPGFVSAALWPDVACVDVTMKAVVTCLLDRHRDGCAGGGRGIGVLAFGA